MARNGKFYRPRAAYCGSSSDDVNGVVCRGLYLAVFQRAVFSAGYWIRRPFGAFTQDLFRGEPASAVGGLSIKISVSTAAGRIQITV
jgi:hypothetical protein